MVHLLPPLTVGVVCDYAEEGWPSMDLAAELLVDGLRAHAPEWEPAALRPRMPRAFGRVLRGRTGHNADRLMARHLAYPRWLRRHARGMDLYHVADHSYAHLVHALPAARTVVTCHDLDAFRSILDPKRDPRPAWFRAMSARLLGGLRRAAFVVCDSDAVRAELLSHGVLPAERVATVPLPAHPHFSPEPDAAADAEAARLLGPPGARVDLLHVGSTVPRKRIPLLLKAFAELAPVVPGARLVRVGGALEPEQRRIAEQHEIADRIVEVPFVERKTLAAIYRRAALVVYPSEREGFGLPLVEAMACGATAVAADLTVFREVAGDAVRYVTRAEPDAWAEALGDALDRLASPEVRAEARAAALHRAERYTLAAYAHAIARVYANVLEAA
ncbi:MAG TPA: glycosyltransferase family 1 protein [Longimicrobium sp.]|nr:glycosyltransferase family 1 protein [Longimicrobium sp.]